MNKELNICVLCLYVCVFMRERETEINLSSNKFEVKENITTSCKERNSIKNMHLFPRRIYPIYNI